VGASHAILQSPADWAAAVAALPAGGPLPVRTVLVPAERHAHSLRRTLLRSGQAAVLAGTRFVGPATLAREVLGAAGRELVPGEESLRPARLLALLDEDLPLEHFDLDLLRATPGWPEAFASAIGDLEGAGLSPDRLPAWTPQWRDLALLWRRLDEAAGASATAARVYSEAAALLERGARLEAGTVLAAVSGRETAAQARFVRSLPGVAIALLAARPLRDRQLDRIGALYGAAAREALASAPLPEGVATERDLLARFLFAGPEVLADPDRPRSGGPDGTVELSEHAGVEDEVAAAAEWVARQVLERRTPLEEVAILLPVQDPLASLVASRLARIPWKDGALPVHVAGGLPASASAGGTRALALVRALSSFLPAEAMAGLLPALRASLGDRKHLGHSEASSLAWSLGTVGGNAAHPEGALSWSGRAAAREARLEEEVARLARDPAAEEREAWTLRPALEALRAARPALDALVAVARLVVEERPLSAIAPALLAFLEEWLLDPGRGTPIRALLAGALEGARADALASRIRGTAALGLVEELLLGLRVATSRFGDPAVYVGTIGGAAGLEFQAVRVLGLGEGSLPSPGREDPVLPDRMRTEVHPLAVPVSADRALGQLHAFDRAVRGAARSVGLSAPRSDLERSEREVSSLLIEAGAALGRPDPVKRSTIPDLSSLARTSLGPARAAAAAFRDAHPLTAAQWLDRAAACGEVPTGWRRGTHLDLTRILDLRAPAGLGPADGVLGEGDPFPPMPGIAPERPISASALETLLGCPLAFLYRRILRWDEPGGAPPLRELDPLSYGSLFHEVMERFYRENGAAFVAREKALGHWRKVAREVADVGLSALLASYPLVGGGIREKERGRLLRDVERFLEYDWHLPLSRFVGVERPFGTPDPVALDAEGLPLHVRGYVDRIDEEGDHALLRDLKTGRDHLRVGDEEGPTPVRDVQLGLYGLVARRLAGEWGIPRKLQVAYAYARSGEERAFRDDYGKLEKAAKGWLALSARLLAERSFPPTPVAEDCALCPFHPVCGVEVPARSAAYDVKAMGAVAEFLALKKGDA
jgi:RecB family exonuclease